jgi:hypothetical protein
LAEQYDWVVGYQDEVWWSRFARPALHLWSDADHPPRVPVLPVAAHDPDPQALACYGLWCERQEQMLLRFVEGRPVSHVTTAFLEWACAELAQQGHKVLVLIWDNASWHVSREVQEWLAAHNAEAKRTGEGLRILVVGLPTKSPWLNTIEPKWQHGKQAIGEADAVLTADETEARVCAYFKTPVAPHLVQVKKERAVTSKRGPQATAARQPEQPRHAAKSQQAA